MVDIKVMVHIVDTKDIEDIFIFIIGDLQSLLLLVHQLTSVIVLMHKEKAKHSCLPLYRFNE